MAMKLLQMVITKVSLKIIKDMDKVVIAIKHVLQMIKVMQLKDRVKLKKFIKKYVLNLIKITQ